MASYQIRQRDPLLDQKMQALLERRGRELIGVALLLATLMIALMLGSYTAGDPGWMAATDGPVHNLLGKFGATIASPLIIIAGRGAWGLVVVLLIWSLRFIFHRGSERALNRVIFAPIAIAVLSVYASTLTPGPGWHHSFGLGGLFGDTVLGAVLGVVPLPAAFALKLMSLIMAVAVIAMGLFVTGFDGAEVKTLGKFLALGVVLLYAGLLRLMGRTASGGAGLARSYADTRRSRRAEVRARAKQHDANDYLPDAEPNLRPEPMTVGSPLRRLVQSRDHAPEPHFAAEQHPAPLVQPTKATFLSRMPGLVKRASMPAPEPELVEPGPQEWDETAPSEDRIRARITSAIHARAQARPEPVRDTAKITVPEDVPPRFRLPRFGGGSRAPRQEPPLTASTRAEPPVTANSPAPAPAASAISRAVGAALARAPRNAPAPMAVDVEDLEGDYVPDHLADYDAVMEPDYAPADPQMDHAAGTADYPDADIAAAPSPTPRVAAPEPRRVVQHPPHKPAQPSRRAQEEAQPALRFAEPQAPAYEHPPLGLLTNPAEVERHHLSDEALEENARMLETVLDDYGVKGEIVSVRPGPVVTMYELEPAPGLKASRVIGLADDIARSMSALSARVSTVPGRSVIGIELPNANREKVVLREILSARDFGDSHLKLPLALGKDIGGGSVVANLAKMPHLLIAGTTGSGKSVAINTMILSLLYKLSPEECRLIMIDPKMLELSVYDGIPHLLSPVVTDPKKAVVALKWVVGEMEERYRKMSKMGVRNIEGFNGRVKEAQSKGELFKRTIQTGFDEDTGEPVFETEEFEPKSLPYIVVIVDEMADLMMVAGKEIEACIQRLAQMARASGIHLIMATQRPSVDVITGTIKANFPTRISFQVTSKIDSRTILGEQGAEQLLGMGDMLYMAGGSRIIRVHGPFVSDEEVEEVVNHLKSFGPPEYMSGVVEGPDDEKADDIDLVLGLGGNTDGEDALYDQAVAVVLKDRKVSTSYIQRKLAIGYNKAARLVEQMEEEGLVSAANHVGKREILVPEQ
ncbi:cell division protein FtsK [Defluviimonas sp. 20V17]|uniref:DNA translocase FtsK n=1 Tax=Allgaiera indica TaxID=765699 RepID=A0AAN4ZXR1_9RHOB|nr:DNA translocase FtsK [Allgaiera indica]KDB02206.1 cell division protein FtsK [Defluviimonas sp. 20V17]GHD98849.1 DNA translocase FtsK [Allgaiera indica]SDW04818.1 DNA translocase FtsK [Allgaiera indica]